MKKLVKTLFPCLALVAIATSGFAQVIAKGMGAPVKAKVIDARRFYPLIDSKAHVKEYEKDHELRRTFPFGRANGLVPGGVLDDERIVPIFSSKFPGISATGAEPPDPDIAVGPSHVVEVVNSSIAFYSKQGTKVFEQTFQNFLQAISPEAFDFDPKVIYDQVAKRFVVLDLGLNEAASGGSASLLIAVSKTSDPLGQWSLFKVDVKQTEGSTDFWWDYPGLGYNKDMICATGNMFQMAGNSLNGVQIVCFDKAQLYSGTATPVKFKVTDGFTMQLAKSVDINAGAVYGVETESQNSMRLTAITKSGSNFAVKQASVAVPQWRSDDGFVIGPGNIAVQTNDPRTLVASSFNGRLASSHTVAVSNSDGRPAARWYDFKLNNWPTSGSPTLGQSGQLDPPSGHGYTFPAICFDTKGSLGMSFSKIGTTTPGDVMGTGRRSTDLPGLMGAPITLEKSTASQYGGFSTRWGDYFDVELDPTDSKTFWAVGMGAGASVNGRWQTYMKSFKISLTDTDLTAVLAQGVTPIAGTYVSGTKSSLDNTDGNVYSLKSQSVKGLGQVAGFNSLYTVPFTNIDTLRMFLTVNGPTGGSAIVTLQNKTTGAYDTITTIGLTNTPISKTLELTVDQIATYVKSNGVISLIVRAVNPTRSGQMPQQFTFTCDRAAFAAAPKS